MEKLPYKPDENGYVVNFNQNEFLELELTGGENRTRRDLIDPAHTVNLTFTCDPAKYAAIVKFMGDYVGRNCEPFLIDLQIYADAYTEETVALVPNSFKLASHNALIYVLTMDVEIATAGTPLLFAGYIGSTSVSYPDGGGSPSTVELNTPAGTENTDGLIVAVLTHYGSIVTSSDFSIAGNQGDSSGGIRLWLLAAAFDGTSKHLTVDAGEFIVLTTSLRFMSADPLFPSSYAASGALQFGSEAGPGLNPRQVTRTGADKMMVLAYAYLEQDVNQFTGAQITSFPTGYAQGPLEKMTIFEGRTLWVQLAMAYKITTPGTENPPSFLDGSGAYGGGGANCASFGVKFKTTV